MDKIFTLKNYKIASLVFAFLFLFFGIFNVKDVSGFSFDVRSTPSRLAVSVGVIFLIISIIIYFEIGVDIFNLNTIKIKNLKNNRLSVQ